MMACSLHNLIVLFLIFLKPGCITAFSSKNGTVFYTNGKYHIDFGVLDSRNGVAYGTYEDTINTTGWSVLNVVSGTGVVSYSDEVVMFAAGYLEGALTAERINENYVNNYDIFFRKSPASLVRKTAEWFDTQEEWMRNKIAKESSSSFLWRQMGHIIAQFDGLIAGYADHPATEKALGKFAFQLLNGVGDYLTIQDVLNPKGLPDWDKMEENEIFTRLGRRGHCSVLIKVLPGYEDILAGHSTWFAYGAALRIYKHYHFNLKDPSTAAKRMSFSSYPGYLVSLDDFYIMDSGIAMLQTTNDIFSNSLLNFVTPESLLAWHRVRLSNLMAHNGEEWAEIYKQYNSGTYNNQYMVLDLKKVELKKPLQKGALWVVEQIPGRRRINRRRTEDLGVPNQTSTSTSAATTPSSSAVTSTATAPSSSTATIFSNPSAASSSTVTSAASSSTATSAANITTPSSSTTTASAATNNEPSSSADTLQRITIPEATQRTYNRPPPMEGECLVCFEGQSTPPTPCCAKPLCNECLSSWLNQRRITCPHCRERLPNEMLVRSQEASDALLNDPDFQRRIRALLDVHERWYYELYGDDYFYTEIRNGLNALASLNVDNFLDAVRELRNFCSRIHHPTSDPLCGPCEITKNLIREVENEAHPKTFLF